MTENKFAAFDLEIARIMPVDAGDLWQYAPLGITCAGIAYSDGRYDSFSASPELDRDASARLVRHMTELVRAGWTIVTWNGCGFDFRVLAEASGLYAECGTLALSHVDLMVHVTFRAGYYLGLDKALVGAKLMGKQHNVTLADGSVIDKLGPAAPRLWAQGEQQVVLDYLQQDCEQTLALARDIARRKRIDWTSQRGRPQTLSIPALASVQECFRLPEPDTSWMSNPPTRRDFVKWIPQVDAIL